MDAVFRFHFFDGDTGPPSHSLAFYVANLNTSWNRLDWILNCVQGYIEAQYGDISKLRDMVGSKPGTTLIGYRSWSIHGERCEQVMNVWRSAFLNHFTGCVVSDVCDVAHLGNINTVAIFEHTQQAHERQQQAQLLRETLDTHITTSGYPTVAKKI